MIEMLLLVSVTSLIALIATSILFSVLQQHAAMREQLLIGNSQTRLSDRFRKDVQQAVTLERTESAITLVGPRRLVRYAHVPPGLIRRTTQVDDESPRADGFDLQSNHDVRFNVDDLFGRKIVTMIIRPSGMDENALPNQPFAISYLGMTTVAELAREYRWSAEEEAE